GPGGSGGDLLAGKVTEERVCQEVADTRPQAGRAHADREEASYRRGQGGVARRQAGDQAAPVATRGSRVGSAKRREQGGEPCTTSTADSSAPRGRPWRQAAP